ncbi:MAG TPA: hypothetical protein PKO12_11930, partial [Holophaga sp.]|nr:hypothetical protein [Holophaga sp.]
DLLIAAAWAGLWRVDPSDPGLKAERIVVPGWPKEYGVQWVTGDGKGGFWTAGGSWVAHFDGRAWAILGPEGGLPAQDGVLAMSPAPGESVWMSYHLTKGVDRVQRQGDRLVLAERLGQGHPVAQHQIYSLLTESDGTLWIGTNRGALRWDGKRAERYGRNAGLPGEDCSQNALWLDPDGDLFVGLSVGIARGELARRTPQLPPAAVIVAAEDARNHSLLGEALPQVRWEDRTLTFRYATGGSRWTEDCAFQVRLAGLEQEWRTTKLPEARYTELSPGRYRFEVRTVTFLGETGEPVGFDLEILAPWWRKPYALGLWALLLGLLVVGFLRWRTAQLRRRNAHLEALVHERTAA